MQQTFKQYIAESDKMQKLAKLLNVSGKDIDAIGQDNIEAILTNVGEHDFVPDSKFDPVQLKMGIESEREHTKSLIIAKLIAKDHLSEDPNYYTKLKKMESK
jgi:hypothetical protein